MKRAVFHSIMALALVVGLTLAMALPVVAQQPGEQGGKRVLWDPADGHPEGFYLVGQTITYELYIDNDDDVASISLPSIRDRFGVESDGGWREGAIEYWWNDDTDDWVLEDPIESVTIAALDSWTEQFSHIINDDHLFVHEGVKKVYNQILAFGLQGLDEVTIDQTIPVRVIEPSIQLEKTVTPSVAGVGHQVEYRFTITNTGDWPLENIVLEDPFFGLTYSVPGVLGPGDDFPYGPIYYTIQAEDLPLPLTNEATVTAIAQGFDDDKFAPEASPTAVVEDRDTATVRSALLPVGGSGNLVSRLALLMPWIVLAGLMAGAAVFFWSRRAQGRA